MQDLESKLSHLHPRVAPSEAETTETLRLFVSPLSGAAESSVLAGHDCRGPRHSCVCVSSAGLLYARAGGQRRWAPVPCTGSWHGGNSPGTLLWRNQWSSGELRAKY